MEPTTIFLGIVVSLGVQVYKRITGATGIWLTAYAVLLAAASAGVYTLLEATGYWGIASQVIATTGAFYAFIIRNLE